VGSLGGLFQECSLFSLSSLQALVHVEGCVYHQFLPSDDGKMKERTTKDTGNFPGPST